MESEKALLVVKNLRTSFEVPAGEVRSVSGISFSLNKGNILGIVGESGSGKSVTAASLMQILASQGHIKEGSSIVFENEELVGMPEKDLRKIRGNKMAMIFQDPMTALNPVYTIGHQMEEALLLHKTTRIEALIEPQERKLRDDKTALNRLLSVQKALDDNSPDFSEQIKKCLIQETSLRAAIAKDRMALSIAQENAKAQEAYEKTVARREFVYKAKRFLYALSNAVRGISIGKKQEASRFANEKEAALRCASQHEKDKLILSMAEKKRLHVKEWLEKIEPLKLELAEKTISKERRDALLSQIASHRLNYRVAEKNDRIALHKATKGAEETRHELLRRLREDHKARLKDLKAKGKETIAQSINDLKCACEDYRSHFRVTRFSARKKAIEMLTLVGVNEPEKRMKQYPYEFSGGMLQRVMIAMALLCNPDLLIADEPTTALDVTIQAQILELIKNVQKKLGMGVIIITHDLGVVAQICDEVDVMYAGRIVERGTVDEIFYNPKHEYTKGLMASIPGKDATKGKKLHPIEGSPVDVFALPKGCSFAPRCEKCMEVCLSSYPDERTINERHYSSCFYSAFEDVKLGKISKEDFIVYLNKGFEIDTNNLRKRKSSLIKRLALFMKIKIFQIKNNGKAGKRQ